MQKQQLQKLQQFNQRFQTEQPLYTLDDGAILAPYVYGQAINDFRDYMYSEQLIPRDYTKILDKWYQVKDQKQFITTLGKEECVQLLGAFIRQDRFIDGLLAGEINSGHVTAVINRLQEII